MKLKIFHPNFLIKLSSLILLFTFVTSDEIKISLSSPDDGDNSTLFVATKEWQEIKSGHKVPQGLHYRLNLQTGLKEAKLLDPEDESPTSLQSTPSENQPEDPQEIESARNRLEDALKNIPSEKFDDVTEEKWKELSKQFRSYEKIKEELKEIDLNPRTEGEVLTKLLDEFKKASSDDEKIEILKDVEYLMHSIDNSLMFIDLNAVETILIPNLVNQSNFDLKIVSIKIFGVMLQNNLLAKKFIAEKTNLVNEILTIFAKASKDELSATIFASGSLLRNNKFISVEIQKKFLNILQEILSKNEILLNLKVKSLTLIDDLVNEFEELQMTHKLCENIENFLTNNRNLLIADSDSMEKAAASLLSIQSCHNNWSESPNFRHLILVVLQNYKGRIDEENFLNLLIVEHLENINKLLYGELKISDDDLNIKYDGNLMYGKDEL